MKKKSNPIKKFLENRKDRKEKKRKKKEKEGNPYIYPLF